MVNSFAYEQSTWENWPLNLSSPAQSYCSTAMVAVPPGLEGRDQPPTMDSGIYHYHNFPDTLINVKYQYIYICVYKYMYICKYIYIYGILLNPQINDSYKKRIIMWICFFRNSEPQDFSWLIRQTYLTFTSTIMVITYSLVHLGSIGFIGAPK